MTGSTAELGVSATSPARRAGAILTALTLLTTLLGVSAPTQAAAETVAAPSTLALSSSNTFSAGGALALNAETDTTLTGTGLFVSIWDLSAGTRVVLCTEGTSCAGTSSFLTGEPHTYRAFLTEAEPGEPPATYLLSSATATGERASWTVTLTQDKTEFAPNESVLLSASTNQDVGATGGNYQLIIRDQSTGTNLQSCYSGTTCEASSHFTTGPPRTYEAIVARVDSMDWHAFTDVQATSNALQVARAPWSVALTSSGSDFANGSSVSLAATTNHSVGHNAPFKIWIKDLTSNKIITSCESGSSCTGYATFYEGDPHTYQAYVATSATGAAIEGQEAVSNEVVVSRKAWVVTLVQDKTQFQTGELVKFTAQTNQSLGGLYSPYKLWILDLTENRPLKRCDFGTSCVVSTNFRSGGPHTYAAVVATDISLTGEISNQQTESNHLTASRKPWTLSITQNKQVFPTESPVVFTVRTNQLMGANYGPYRVQLYDLTSGQLAGGCFATPTCTIQPTFYSGPPHTYQAVVVESLNADGSPVDPQAYSGKLQTRRLPWTVNLAQQGTTLTVAANQEVGHTNNTYQFWVLNHTTGTTFKTCPVKACSFTVPPENLGHVFEARIARAADPKVDILASSDGFSAETGRDARAVHQVTGGGNPSETNPQCKCIDPINTATGEFYDTFTDLTLPNRIPLSLSRTYSTSRADQDGTLGWGWTTNYNSRLLVPANPADPAVVVQENGAETLFNANNGTYNAAPNVHAALVKNASGTWTFVRDRATTFQFDAAGKLTSVSDRNGESLSFTYVADKLSTVRSKDGRGFDLTYTAGRLTQVSDTTGRSVSYDYNTAGELTSMVDARGKTWSYGYDSAHRLTTRTNPLGKSLTNEYDSQGRAVKQTDERGGVATLAYTEAAVAVTGTTITRSTDQTGRVIDYWYDNGWLVRKVLDPESATPATWNYVLDGAGNTLQATDPLGHSTYATYDGSGRRLTATDATGRKTSWTYSAQGDVLSTTDPAGITMSATSDTRGNLLTSTQPLTPTASAQLALSYADPTHPGDPTTMTDPLSKATTLTYNAFGQVATSTTPMGRISSYAYNARGQMLSTTSPRGNAAGATAADYTTSFTYDAAGLPLTRTDGDGRITSFEYDDLGRLTATVDSALTRTETVYDELGNVLTLTDEEDRVTTFVYDPASRLLYTVTPGGAKTSHTYDRFGQLATSTSPRGNVPGASPAVKDAATTTYSYDLAGQLTSVSRPNPAGGSITVSHEYDPAGRRTATVDPLGRRSTVEYDTVGRQIASVDPLGRRTTLAYDLAGRVRTSTDALNNTTTFTHDARGARTAVLSPEGRKTSLTYDDDGRLISSTDPRGHAPGANPAQFRTFLGYDLDGNPISVTNPLGHVSAVSYDNLGRHSSSADAKNQTTSFSYDARDRLVGLTAPDGGSTTYSYDATGLLLSTTKPSNGVTTLTRDPMGRVLTSTDPLGNVENFTYDIEGNLTATSTTPGAGITAGPGSVAYTHDALNRLTGIDYSDATPDVAFSYDAAGQRTQMTDGEGTEGHTRDDAGALTATARASSGGSSDSAFSYTYDGLGRIKTRTYPDSTQVSYTYDKDGLPLTVTKGSGSSAQTTSFTYGAAGQLSLKTLPSGATQASTYDAAGRPASQVDKDAHGNSIASRSWTHDAVGNPMSLSIVRPSGTIQRSWAYDTADRLLSECNTAGPCTSALSTESWAWDAAGNRTHATSSTGITTYAYNAADQITTSTTVNTANPLGLLAPGGLSTSFQYDAAGNLLTDGKRSYSWNAAGKLKSLTEPSGTGSATTTYAYDGNGNRVRATKGSGASAETTRFDWDVNNPLPVLAVERPGTGDVAKRTQVYSPDGTTPLTLDADGVSAEYMVDPLGSVTELLGSTGARAASFDYGPFGGPRAPPVANAPGSVTTTLGFTGQYQDPTGLLHLRARQYDPNSGVFLSRDPLNGAGDLLPGSLYLYGNGNPLVWADISGLMPCDAWEARLDSILCDVNSAVRGVGRATKNVAVATATMATPEGQAQFVSHIATSYQEGGIALAANQFNPVYHLIENGTAFIEAALNGCVGDAAEAGTSATFDAVGTVSAAAAGPAALGRAHSPGKTQLANDEAGNYAMNAIHEPGFHDVVAHGRKNDPRLYTEYPHTALSAAETWERIQANPAYQGENLRLLVCEGAARTCNAAQALAQASGKTVSAPLHKVHVNDAGVVMIRPEGQKVRPTVPSDFIPFGPKGASG